MTTEWLLRFSRALAADDPEESLRAALELLAEIGVEPREQAEGAWLTVACGDESLALGAPSPPPDSATEELLGNLLRAAMARRANHRELTRTRERMEMLSAASFEGLMFHVDRVVVDANQRLAEMTGYELRELLGAETFERCVAEEDKPSLRARIAAREEGAHVITAVRKDGSRFRAELLSKQGRLGDRPVRVAAVRDVTERERQEMERRRLEAQVERSQRLDSLGVLAGGIAHDFNNLLVGILGNAEFLLARLEAPHDVEAAATIRTAGLRAADLTRQMLAYAGKSALARRATIDLRELWDELRALLDATLSKKARLSVSVDPQCLVTGERATVMQVFMNLLTNASDALGNKPGVIDVTARRVGDPGPGWSEALGASVSTGDWVLIEVRDDGEGMDEATRARIFEPFFSTKPRGHGLGLAACLGIVRSHGGAIRVRSAPGKGSSFSVLLPAAGERPRAAPSPESPGPGDKACRVLVVDDEEVVRAYVRRVLEEHGYTVEEARDGKSALAAFARFAPDLVVLDFSMPDLDGNEVVAEIRRTGSPVPIVLTSGYIELAAERGLPADAVQATLRKPYAIAELLAALHRVRP